MFEKISRAKIRFESGKGLLSVEDLWDLPLSSATGKANLDDIARNLYAALKSDATMSFVNKAAPADELAQLKFDVVKHIIDVRLVENAAANLARDNAAKKQRILAILADREEGALREAPIEELKAMLATL